MASLGHNELTHSGQVTHICITGLGHHWFTDIMAHRQKKKKKKKTANSFLCDYSSIFYGSLSEPLLGIREWMSNYKQPFWWSNYLSMLVHTSSYQQLIKKIVLSKDFINFVLLSHKWLTFHPTQNTYLEAPHKHGSPPTSNIIHILY